MTALHDRWYGYRPITDEEMEGIERRMKQRATMRTLYTPPPPQTRECQRCHARFYLTTSATGKPNTLCPPCRKKPRLEEKKCAQCGTLFVPQIGASSTYCRFECYVHAERDRRRAGEEGVA